MDDGQGGSSLDGGPRNQRRGLNKVNMARHRKISKTKKSMQKAGTATLVGATAIAIATSSTPAYAQPNETTVETPAIAPAPEAPVLNVEVPTPQAMTIPGGERVVSQAREYFGVEYAWGGEDESGMDCSGLVWRVFQDLGIDLGVRQSDAMAGVGEAVGSLDEAQAGDLLVFNGHVGIYVSPGRMIDSADYGQVVQERDIWGTPVAIRRVSVDGEEVISETPPVVEETPPVVEVASVETTSEYTVVENDWLSKIAPKLGLSSWEELYADNEATIGPDPNLILPGQVFFVGGLPVANAPVEVPAEEPVTETTQVVGDYAAPCPGAYLSQGYDIAHGGIDLAAEKGTPIYAAASGTVTVAGPRDPGGFGQAVYITGDDGYTYWYGHIDTWQVNAGDHVEAGVQIATVGNRGNSYGANGGYHLHFEVRIGPGSINAVTHMADRGINF